MNGMIGAKQSECFKSTLSLFMLMGMNISIRKDREENLWCRFPVSWSRWTEIGNVLSCMSSI